MVGVQEEGGQQEVEEQGIETSEVQGQEHAKQANIIK
jgi:hypothetical protein